MKNTYIFIVILFAFAIQSIRSQGKPLKPNCTNCIPVTEKLDINRVTGEISFSEENELHWGLAVVAVLPFLIIIIAIIIWKLCKNGRNNDAPNATVDGSNKTCISREESSF
jgi:hypothetical protein